MRFEGARGSREGAALVDTGYSLTLLDAAIAAEVGAKLTGRTIKLAAADGHEVAGELGIVKWPAAGGEELPGRTSRSSSSRLS